MNKIIQKNYGSIPHLSTSKLTQQADKKITPGQELILTKKARDWKDLIIVTEKMDGSNVGVYIGDYPIPITRAGYHCDSSQYKQHNLFSKWVYKYCDKFKYLPKGYRVAGEWCIMAHGTKYSGFDYSNLFLAFDIFDNKNNRLCYLDFVKLCSISKLPQVPILHIGQPISIKNAVKLLGEGSYSPEKPEGVVYQCERDGKVDFLAKWVRADKEDGKYMKDEIYNF